MTQQSSDMVERVAAQVCPHGIQRFLRCDECIEEDRCECDDGMCVYCEQREEMSGVDIRAVAARLISEELGLTHRAWDGAMRAAKVVLEASHHAELVKTLQRCRRFLTSNWSANEAEACLNELDALLPKMGRMPEWAASDLRTVEFRLALSKITEHYPPDTLAGQLAANALAKHPNRFAKLDGAS